MRKAAMKVFISWSKEPAKSIAEELRHVLSAFVPGVEPWMSEHDLVPGQRWGQQIAEHLADAKIALICVTERNKAEPWLHFEAGAISNALGESFVHPVIFEAAVESVPATLTQFQVTRFTQQSFFSLVRTLNKLRDKPESEHDLRQRFDRVWPGMEATIKEKIAAAPPLDAPVRPTKPSVAKIPGADLDAEATEHTKDFGRGPPMQHGGQNRSFIEDSRNASSASLGKHERDPYP
jgi:hypothetical protein